MKFTKPLYLVLGSGGARGLAHIGAVEALQSRGIVPDVILGCSMGAVVGAFYAAGWTGPQMRELASANSGKALRRLVDPAIPMRGLIRGQRVARFIRRNLNTELIEDLPRPFVATSLDLQRGRMAIFDHGPLVRAIMASIAIPGVFPPLENGGHYYVDGGVVSPIPTKVAYDRGAGSIIAVDVSPWIRTDDEDGENEPEKPDESSEKQEALQSALALVPFLQGGGDNGGVLERLMGSARSWSDRVLRQVRHWRLEQKLLTTPHIAQTMIRSMMIMQREMGDMHLKLYPPTVLIRPELHGMRAYNFDRMEECIDEGRRAAEVALKAWEANAEKIS